MRALGHGRHTSDCVCLQWEVVFFLQSPNFDYGRLFWQVEETSFCPAKAKTNRICLEKKGSFIYRNDASGREKMNNQRNQDHPEESRYQTYKISRSPNER